MRKDSSLTLRGGSRPPSGAVACHACVPQALSEGRLAPHPWLCVETAVSFFKLCQISLSCVDYWVYVLVGGGLWEVLGTPVQGGTSAALQRMPHDACLQANSAGASHPCPIPSMKPGALQSFNTWK